MDGTRPTMPKDIEARGLGAPGRRLWLTGLVVLGLWSPAASVEAAPAFGSGPALALAPARDDAGAHFEAAAELYAREDYAGAAREFAIAYALDPQVDTLFAWAQAERLAERYDQALELYNRLLAGELSDKQREAIVSLRAEVGARVGPPETAEPEASETTEAAEPEPGPKDAPGRAGPKREVAGPVLTGFGVGLSLVGGGLLIGGAVADARVRNADTYPEFEAAYDPRTGRGRGAVNLYAAGGVLAGVGLATLIAGAVRIRRARRASDEAQARVGLSPWFGATGGGFVVRVEGLR